MTAKIRMLIEDLKYTKVLKHQTKHRKTIARFSGNRLHTWSASLHKTEEGRRYRLLLRIIIRMKRCKTH